MSFEIPMGAKLHGKGKVLYVRISDEEHAKLTKLAKAKEQSIQVIGRLMLQHCLSEVDDDTP